MIKKIFLPLFALALGMTSCERDDDKYTSTCPVIHDMTFKSVVTETDRIVAGEKFVATVEQAQKGHLLDLTVYTWSDGRDVGIHKPTFTTLVYDSEPINPTDTIIFTNPGVHQVKLVAKYRISGNADASVVRTEEIPGGKVQYQVPSWMYYLVTVTKNVRVEAAP